LNEREKKTHGMSRNKKKTYRVNNIPAELLQAIDEETEHNVYCFINNTYTTGKIRNDFKKIILVILAQKSKSTKREEYRTFSILIHTSKILTKIILGRI